MAAESGTDSLTRQVTYPRISSVDEAPIIENTMQDVCFFCLVSVVAMATGLARAMANGNYEGPRRTVGAAMCGGGVAFGIVSILAYFTESGISGSVGAAYLGLASFVGLSGRENFLLIEVVSLAIRKSSQGLVERIFSDNQK